MLTFDLTRRCRPPGKRDTKQGLRKLSKLENTVTEKSCILIYYKILFIYGPVAKVCLASTKHEVYDLH